MMAHGNPNPYNVSITLQNTGTYTWTRDDLFRLASYNPYNNSTWGMAQVELAPGQFIAPGQSKAFNFAVTAPQHREPTVFNGRWCRRSWSSSGAATQNVNIVVQ